MPAPKTLTDADFEQPKTLTDADFGGGSKESPAAPPGVISRFAGAVGESLNPMPLIRALGDSESRKAIFQQPGVSANRAIESFKGGNYGEAAKSAIGAIPLVGASAEQIARESTEGKIPEALGHVAGFMAGPKILKGVGRGVGAMAPPLAESALGIKAINRAYGRKPGLAALEETSGVRPGTVAEQAQNKLGQIDTELSNVVGRSTNPVDLQPARTRLADAESIALRRNAAKTVNQLQPMQTHLSTSLGSGRPLARFQQPSGALALKRGFGDEFIHNWNPETMRGVKGTAAQTYHDLAEGIHTAVPESKPLDVRSSSLIPVAQRAEAIERGPGLLQNTMGRVAAKTGGMALGGGLGYAMGGWPGMVAGTMLPEMITTPAVQMSAARGLHLTGRGLQRPMLGRAMRAAPILGSAEQEYQRGK